MDDSEQHPPKVMPVLQIGFIGHRNLPGAESDLLQKILHDLLTNFQTSAEKALTEGWPYDVAGTMEFRLISALAVGADQLAATAALDLGWKLVAPLPFSREIYRNDFQFDRDKAAYDNFLVQASTVHEIDGIPARADSYSAVGHLLLEQSDILVAIWDGEAERGLGGTGEIVRDARATDIPVVVIASNSPHAVRIFATGADTVEDLVAAVLRPPHTADGVDGLAVYLNERKRTAPRLARILAGIERIALFQTRLPARTSVNAGAQSESVNAAFDAVNSVIAAPLNAADQLAVRYATLYRASASLKYLAVIPTTAAALLAFYGPKELQLAAYFVELAILAGTFLIAYTDKKAGWHRRFIDYRYLAEHLRYTTLMAMFGSTSTLPRLPPYQMAADSDWVNWYLHFAVRRLGLITARQDAEYLHALRQVLLKQLEQQIDFYTARAADARVLATRLTRAGIALFVAGVTFTVLHGGLEKFGVDSGLLFDLVTAFALTVPALAPAFFGLRSQREYQRLSQRYEAMVRQLRQNTARLIRDGAIHGQVERVARESVVAMLAEVSDWRVLIKARDLSPY